VWSWGYQLFSRDGKGRDKEMEGKASEVEKNGA